MGIKTPEERARAKHNELVALLAKLNEKRDDQIAALMRTFAKRNATVRAITRSSKRIDKLMALKVATAGPTATAVKPLVEKVADKKPAHPLNDPVPALSGNAKKRQRRTPDDFKADMAARKKSPPANGGQSEPPR